MTGGSSARSSSSSISSLSSSSSSSSGSRGGIVLPMITKGLQSINLTINLMENSSGMCGCLDPRGFYPFCCHSACNFQRRLTHWDGPKTFRNTFAPTHGSYLDLAARRQSQVSPAPAWPDQDQLGIREKGPEFFSAAGGLGGVYVRCLQMNVSCMTMSQFENNWP
jgi:hypothetical protein